MGFQNIVVYKREKNSHFHPLGKMVYLKAQTVILSYDEICFFTKKYYI
jgi:hypothetical protein